MTDQRAASSSPTSPGARSWRRPALIGAVVLPAALLLGGCGDSDDGDDVASDGASSSSTPSMSASTSPSASASATPSPTDSASASVEPTPVIDPVISKAVRPALDTGYPALVTATVPEGWSVDSARYVGADGGSWTMSFTDQGGNPVVLVQDAGSVADLVSANLSAQATESGKVNLKKFGLGIWTLWTGGGSTGLGHALPSTSVLVTGADQASVTALAQTLLAAEDADMPEAG